MGICGCGDRCTCSITSGNANLVITGSGDANDPWVLTVADSPTFQASNSDGIIGITPGGPLGHEPAFNVAGSPGSDYAIFGDGAGGGEWRQVVGSGGVVGGVPVGSGMDFFGSTAPSGWLFQDGGSYDTTVYALLFAEIGYTYGGAGANFNVPDSRGRTTYGLGTHADVNALGDSDGLAVASRTPNHTHTGPSHSHSSGTLAGTTSVDATGPSTTASGASNLNQTGVLAGVNAAEELCLESAAVNNGCAGAGFVTVTAADGTHLHDISHTHSHSHTVSVSSGTTGAAGTGATSANNPGYLVANKIIFAGV